MPRSVKGQKAPPPEHQRLCAVTVELEVRVGELAQRVKLTMESDAQLTAAQLDDLVSRARAEVRTASGGPR